MSKDLNLDILSSKPPVSTHVTDTINLSTPAYTEWLRGKIRYEGETPKHFQKVHAISKSYSSYVNAVVQAGGGARVADWDSIKDKSVEWLFTEILGPNNIKFKYEREG